MNSKDARIFVRLADSRSFKEAAIHMDISRATVSKRIAALEKEFDTILLHRSSRAVSLTQTGTLLLKQCRRFCDAKDDAHQAIHGYGKQPVGAIQLALPTSLGPNLFPVLVREFAQTYPKVTLSIHFFDGKIDVIEKGFDLVIKLADKLDDSNLTAQRLITMRKVLVASPGYLDRRGIPTNVRQLAAHDCLDLGYGSDDGKIWQFVQDGVVVDVRVKCRMTSSCYLPLSLAACMDMGFYYGPELLLKNDIQAGRLKIVLLENTRDFEVGLFAIYPNRHLSTRLRALVDFIKARVDHPAVFDQWPPVSAGFQCDLVSIA